MRRRDFLITLSLLPISATSIGKSPTTCPLCGGHLTKVGSLKDDKSRQSINLEVWNRSYHGIIAEPYSEQSPFCPRCNFAYSNHPGDWRRSSELPDSFFIPLTLEILGFPIAPSRLKNARVVYGQVFLGPGGDQGRTESIGYWASDSDNLRADLQTYADTNALTIRFYTAPSMPGQVSITAETPNNSFKPRPLRGSAAW
jgi:hypothetical protein